MDNRSTPGGKTPRSTPLGRPRIEPESRNELLTPVSHVVCLRYKDIEYIYTHPSRTTQPTAIKKPPKRRRRRRRPHKPSLFAKLSPCFLTQPPIQTSQSTIEPLAQPPYDPPSSIKIPKSCVTRPPFQQPEHSPFRGTFELIFA